MTITSIARCFSPALLYGLQRVAPCAYFILPISSHDVFDTQSFELKAIALHIPKVMKFVLLQQ
jgi:hypothetical protein